MAHATASTNSTDAILGRVQEVFRSELDDDDLTVDLGTRKIDLKAWDSLAHVRLITGLESAFDIQFTLTEIEQIATVRQFVDVIQAHLT